MLENVDSVNGKITIVTKEGKTAVVTTNSSTEVNIEGVSRGLDVLEPGTYVTIEMGKDNENTAQRIEARLSDVQGTIAEVSSNEFKVTLESGGQQITILLGNQTVVKLTDGRIGSLNDLKVRAKVEVKYDPQNNTALKVYVHAG